MVAYRYGLMVERGLRREDGRRINELPMHGHRTSRKPTLQRCTKRWTCLAKQQPGTTRQKFLATLGPPISEALLYSCEVGKGF